jgi:serine phosphatase RsbU (regulator of sigma subunit)
MPQPRALSRTEFRVLLGTALAYWLFAWADHILLSHDWFSVRGLEGIGLSFIQPLVVVLGTVLIAVALQRMTHWLRWETTQRVYKFVRFGILISSVFLSLLAAHAGVPALIPGWFEWGFGIDYDWTLPFGMLFCGLCALVLVWTYRDRSKFVLSCGLVTVVVGGGFALLRPQATVRLDVSWYHVLDAMRPWRSINDSLVTIVTIPEWPGEKQFRRLTEAVVKSRPKVIGLLAPVYFHIAESGDTAFYSSLPANTTVYGVMSDWYHREIHQADFPVPRSVLSSVDRGIITGVEPGNPFSGRYFFGQSYSDAYDWETSYLPVLETSERLRYNEESMDVGLAIVGKYLGIRSPMTVEHRSSFWSSSILDAAGRNIPLNSEGKALIDYPTRFILAGHWFRVARESYPSMFNVGFNGGSQTSSDTLISLTWQSHPIEEAFVLPAVMSVREYRLNRDKIVRYDAEYRYNTLGHVDTMAVQYIPEFHDKIVLITQQRSHMQFVEQDVMGITYASIIQNLVDKDFITPLNRWWVFSFLLFMTTVVVLLFLKKKAVPALGLSVCSLLVCAFAIVTLFCWAQVYVSAIPLIAPCLVALGLLFPPELARERRKLLEERATLASELHTAHEAQMGLMPTSDPVVPGFDISGVCRPAEEVGGDYFDYVWLNEEKTRLGIAIADVSGKAMKAAMTAVMTSGMVYREIGQNQTPKVILREINRPMYFKTDRRIFTAMSFAVIDIVSKGLAFSNAGQMLPLLKRDGAIETVKVDGAHLPLGMAEDVDYGEKTVQLQWGDTVVFYTDGIPEAMNARREMFGFERLEAVVQASAADLSAKQLAKSIVDEVASFTASAKQHDDMTVVVVRVA